MTLGIVGLLLAVAQASVSGTTPGTASDPVPTPAAEAVLDSDSLRTRLQELLVGAAAGDLGAADALDSATRVATALARTWGDSFPLRSVARFARWSPAQRARKLVADSLRREGNEALSREGPAAALALWRRSVAEAQAAGDTAGIAAGLGNIGAGWHSAAELDSAAVYLERSRTMAAAIGDTRALGNALGSLANVAKSRGRWRESRRLFDQAARARARVGDTRGLAADLNNLGLVAEALGQPDSAASLYRRALGLNRRYHREAPAAANLVNLGNLAAARGDYAEATERYRAALGIRRARGEGPEQATILYDLGILATRRGDYLAGVEHLEESRALYQAAGLADGEVSARTALSTVYQAMGWVQEAANELQLAERAARGAGLSPQTRAEVAMAVGDFGLTLNDPAAAGEHYQTAADLYREIGDSSGEAEATQAFGLLLLRRNRPEAAQAQFERVLLQRSSRGDARGVAQARLLLAHTRDLLGQDAEAQEQYASALADFRELDDGPGQAAALEMAGRLSLADGNSERAEGQFAAGLARLGTAPSPTLAASLRSGLAEALRVRGALDQAERVLTAAIGELELVRQRIATDAWRSGFLEDKWTIYSQLVRLHHARGHTERAFAVSERMRARQLLDQLSRGRIRSHDLPPGLASDEQDLRRRIMELASAGDVGLPGRPGDGETTRDPVAVGRELASAQAAYARLLPRLRETDPEYAALVSGTTVSYGDARRRLRPGELLLDYLVLDSATIVFALTSDSLRSFELSGSRADLAALIDFTRGLIASDASAGSRERWRAPLRRLWRLLLAPVEAAGLLEGKQRLVIVPHAELHYLPFAALLGGGQRESFLVERFEVVYAPSVSVWVRLDQRTFDPPSGTVLAVAPQTTTLPGTRGEVELIRQRYGARAIVLRDSAATEGRFLRTGPRHDIVHLATYGILNRRNPLFSYVQLRPDRSHDGRLDAYEAYALGMRPRLLVLSACETALASGALADVPPGDEWIGLVQAFLSAGAGNVLATQWRVSDRSTARLMGEFYDQLIGTGSAATALAQAQRVALSRADSRSPFFWAGFALSGGRAGGI